MNKTIVVLGGTGFIGTTLISELRKNTNNTIISASRTGETKVDILDKQSLLSICRNADIVINCTGQITHPLDDCIRQNSIGIVNLAEVIAQTSARLIHLSTVAVYGTANSVTEESFCNPETPYAAVKYGAEQILQQLISQEQLLILRLSNIYGEQTKGIIGYILKAYQSDHMLHFDNDGTMIRHYIHVEDLVRSIGVCVQAAKLHGIINVIGKETYSIIELMDLLQSISQKKWNVTYENIKPKENIYQISLTKLDDLIHVEQTHTIKEFIVTHIS